MLRFQELKKFLNFIFKLGPIIIIFEVIIVSIMSVSASQVKEVKSLWFGILIFSIVVYAVLKIIKFNYEKLFPKSLVENIESEIKKDELSKGFARKSLINDAISTSLISLNDQTCILADKGYSHYQNIDEVSSRMCDKDVEDGLENLLNPMLSNLHHILEIPNSKLTIGVFLKSIATEPIDQEDLIDTPSVFVLKDEFDFSSILTKELMEMDEVKGDQLALQSFIRSSLNNNRFEVNNFKQNGKDYAIILSTIPVVCDDGSPNGVLFVVTEKLENYPIDLEEIFNIFNRIIANWISKYNECVWSRYNSKEVYTTIPLESNSSIILYSNYTWKEGHSKPD